MKPLSVIYNQSCISGMKKFIGNETIDLIIADPPFGIDFKAKRSNYNRDNKLVLEGYQEPKNYEEFTKAWINECYRVLKDSGSMYVFSGWNNLEYILTALRLAGFITINHPIWKYQFGVRTAKKFVSSHYHIIYVCKNPKKRKFFRRFNDGKANYKDLEDVFVINRDYWTGETKTPTKLPGQLIFKLLVHSSEKGDFVLDPFMGSGETAVQSKLLSRNCYGFEIVKSYYKFILKRLEDGE